MEESPAARRCWWREMQSSPTHVFELAEQFAFGVEVFDDGFDDDPASGQSATRRPTCRRATAAATAAVSKLALGGQRVEGRGDGGADFLRRAPAGVENHTSMPAWADIWAMPRPIGPVPTCPIRVRPVVVFSADFISPVNCGSRFFEACMPSLLVTGWNSNWGASIRPVSTRHPSPANTSLIWATASGRRRR